MHPETGLFRQMILKAQDGDQEALTTIIKWFEPILYKKSYNNGKFDEDCFQELSIILIRCIQNFKFDEVNDIGRYFEN